MKFFRIIILISFFCKTIVLQAQGNLVPNGNFEEYSHCPDFSLGEQLITPLANWYDAGLGASTDYYNLAFTNCSCAFCGCEYCGANNGLGYQQPHSGNGYFAFYCLDYRFSGTGYSGIDYRNGRDHNGVKLSEKLLLGKKYKVSLYLSLSNKSYYAINKFGFYFSNTPVYSSSFAQRIDVVPQVSAPNKFYSDTLNWEKIEGEFIAQGGEEYLTIGNFWQIDDVDTLCVNATTSYKHISYYYIDDVSVECMDCTVGINKEVKEENGIKIYPNPNNGEFELIIENDEAEDFAEATLDVFDLSGRLIVSKKINTAEKPIIKIDASTGIYIYKVTGKITQKVGKLIIID